MVILTWGMLFSDESRITKTRGSLTANAFLAWMTIRNLELSFPVKDISREDLSIKGK